MGARYAAGKKAFGFCDVCGFRVKLNTLKKLTIRSQQTNILACQECWEPDQPQNMQGMRPVYDPQALRNPRPDTSYAQSGTNSNNNPGEGSRNTQWGWAPVGLRNPFAIQGLPDTLLGVGAVGTVTVS